MGVGFFNLLRPVLEQRIAYVAHHDRLSQDQVRNLILEEAARNRDEWFSDRVPNLNYRLAACRLAYLYIIAAVNANTFKWILCNDSILNQYVLNLARTHRRLRVCAFGAGPGTELMAFAKFFAEQRLGFPVQVDFQLLDLVQEWQDSWYGIRDTIHEHFRQTRGSDITTWPIIPTGNFIQQDVTDTQRMTNLGDIWTQDVFVINFLLSELFTDNPGFRDFMAVVSGRAPKGSLFVFIERSGSMWAQRMDSCTREAGIRLTPFQGSQERMDLNEDPEHLGDVYAQLSSSLNPRNQRPRQSWKVVYSIGVKE